MGKGNRHFAQVLSSFMRTEGLTQLSLSEALNVSQPAVNRWCQGEEPGRKNLKALSEYAGISIDDLLGTTTHRATVALTVPAATLHANAQIGPPTIGAGFYYPLRGYITPKGIQPVEKRLTLNGSGRHRTKQPALEPAYARSRGWNPENLVSYTVRGHLPDRRYPDGATVWLETNIAPDDIPDGADVMVRLTNGRLALKTWRAADSGAILIDVLDIDGAPVVVDSKTAIVGVVRAVFG